MEDRQEQAEFQPRGSAFVPFLGSPGIGIVPVVCPVFGVGLGKRAVQNRRIPQQKIQDCADAASGAFLVEGVEQVVSGADQVVSIGVVGAVVAERVVAEFIQGFRDRLAVFCPRLRGRRIWFRFTGLGSLSGVIDIGIGADAVWQRCVELRLRVPLGEEFLLERPGTEILDVGPCAQVLIVDEHAVEAVGRGGYHFQGRCPPLHVAL